MKQFSSLELSTSCEMYYLCNIQKNCVLSPTLLNVLEIIMEVVVSLHVWRDMVKCHGCL